MTPELLIPLAIVIFFAIGLHEYAHCKFADMAGDPTPRIYGRVTLNLFKHFDPLGTIMILITALTGFGIGWGKPAPVDPHKMRNPRWDFFASVAAGPISNVLQAIVWAIFFRLLLSMGHIGPVQDGLSARDFLTLLTFFGVTVNLSLAVFNMIPLGPLDGHWLLGLLMPERARDRWFLWNRQFGWMLLLGVILIGQFVPELALIRRIVGPAVEFLAGILLGAPR